MPDFECQVGYRYLKVLYINAKNEMEAIKKLTAMSRKEIDLQFEYETSHPITTREVIEQLDTDLGGLE